MLFLPSSFHVMKVPRTPWGGARRGDVPGRKGEAVSLSWNVHLDANANPTHLAHLATLVPGLSMRRFKPFSSGQTRSRLIPTPASQADAPDLVR